MWAGDAGVEGGIAAAFLHVVTTPLPGARAGIHKNSLENRRSTYRVDFFASRFKSQLFPWIQCGIPEKGLIFGGFKKS
jgi:hypothetical protein